MEDCVSIASSECTFNRFFRSPLLTRKALGIPKVIRLGVAFATWMISSAVSAQDAQPPSVPTGITATAQSSTQIYVDWDNSTDNVGVTGYIVDRCTGAGCTNFTQQATPSASNFTNTTGITAGSTWRYRVRARDAVPNYSAWSAIATVTTPTTDSQAPTVPANVAASVVSASQINLSWTASTDNVGVTAYSIERCSGSSCTSFVEIAAPTGTTYSNTGLSGSTTYRYRIRARDAVPNWSSYSSIASATTNAGDTQAPTAPANLRTTTVSSTSIGMEWNASTDNVGVTGYLVDCCSGAGCTNFSQQATRRFHRFSGHPDLTVRSVIDAKTRT